MSSGGSAPGVLMKLYGLANLKYKVASVTFGRKATLSLAGKKCENHGLKRVMVTGVLMFDYEEQ